MDAIGTLTSIALQYGVPMEALARKFSHQRFEPSGYTKNPDIRHAASITDYVFRWMAIQFVPGYREENTPNGSQPELTMPGLDAELKKKINRPVPDLAITGEDTDFIKTAAVPGNGAGRPGNGEHRKSLRLTDMIVNQLDAPSCPKCGHITVRNGACFKCLNCGESLGCS